jgi:hypothetical protein
LSEFGYIVVVELLSDMEGREEEELLLENRGAIYPQNAFEGDHAGDDLSTVCEWAWGHCGRHL